MTRVYTILEMMYCIVQLCVISILYMLMHVMRVSCNDNHHK